MARVVAMNPTFLRNPFKGSFWLVIFLLILTISLAAGLSSGIREGITWLLIPIAVAGALTSYGLAKSRLKGWQAGVLLVFFGGIGIIFHITKLFEPLMELINAIVLLRVQIITWAGDRLILPDLTMADGALAEFGNRTTALLTRTWLWLEGLHHGGIIRDPVAQAFAWSIVVFLLSAWAGWMLGRHRNPLVAFTPALAVFAIVSDYTGSGFNILWLMLGGLLILMGLARYDADRVRWQRIGIDFSESIPIDTGSAIIVISVALAALAWVMPSFSVKAMVETIRDLGKSQDDLAESVGLKSAPPPPSNFASYIVPQGLPRSHLMGSGPELNKRVVMTIRTGELPSQPPSSNLTQVPRHYWREVTYDRYTGSGWVSSPVEVNSYKANEPLMNINPIGYRLIQQEVKLYEDLGGQLNWTGYLVSVDQPYEVAWRSRPGSPTQSDPFGDSDLLGAISPVKSFKATSLEARMSLDQLRAADRTYPDWTARYLQLPETTPDRVLALARELTANATTYFDRAQSIETYLRTTYPYTLDVPNPPLGHDVADYFLFDLKKGYCDYYATAMVVLARAAGLPARFVIGYASGSYDPENAQYIVTEASAHSWAEIFFPDIGWVEFEPTAGLPAIDRLEKPVIQTLPLPPTDMENETAIIFFERVFTSFIKDIILGFVIIILVIISALWIESWWLALQPVNISLTQIFRRMERLGNQVMSYHPFETPLEFSDRLMVSLESITQRGWQSRFIRPALQEVDLITDIYVYMSFSQHPVPNGGLVNAINTWRRLRLRLLLADFHQRVTGQRKRAL